MGLQKTGLPQKASEDPCVELSMASLKCAEKNPKDKKEVCDSFFEAYKECRRTESNLRRERRIEQRGSSAIW